MSLLRACGRPVLVMLAVFVALAEAAAQDAASLETAHARQLLAGLAHDFPGNTLFLQELRRIDSGRR